ncbi:MAG: FN3 associated domain-containing protein [Bacteroidales bacterium]|nr:FN3 associated domain-containing protein [Bacteroidales bacterium]
MTTPLKNATSLSSRHRAMALFTALLLGISGAWAQTYYVIYTTSGNITHFLAANTAKTGVTDIPLTSNAGFSAACIWEYTSNGYLRNVATGSYLYGNGTTLSLSSSVTRWTRNNNGNFSYTYRYFYTYYTVELRYDNNSGWIARYNSTSGTRGSSTSVSTVMSTVALSNVQISEPAVVSESATYSATAIAQIQTDYSVTANGTAFSAPANTYSASISTSTSGYSWTWSESSDFVDFTPNSSTLHVTGTPEYDQTFPITATVSYNSNSGVTATGSRMVSIYGQKLAPPIIARVEGTNTFTLATESPNAQLRYTIGVSEPSDPDRNSDAYPGSPQSLLYDNTAISPSICTVYVKAVTERNGILSTVTDTAFQLMIAATPVITIDNNWEVTIQYMPDNTTPPGTEIHYTTDGTTPTAQSPIYSVPFRTSQGSFVQAVLLDGCHLPSAAAKKIAGKSGLYGNVVVLNDYEDHRFSYYTEDSPIHSLHPCNVAIKYKGGGVEGASAVGVGIDLPSVNEFDYYKTLEKAGARYPYATIPNPFSKRPATGTGSSKVYYGFNGWKITSITGTGTVYNAATGGTAYAVGNVIPAETTLYFDCANPTPNATMATVELTAQWDIAYVVTCDASRLSSSLYDYDYSLNGDSYEKNFIVVTGGTNTTDIYSNPRVPVTISMVYPDGTASPAFTSNTSYLGGNFQGYNDTKFEYIHLNGTEATYTANNANSNPHDNALILGRGISNTTPGAVCVKDVQGIYRTNTAYTNNLNYVIRIESGVYNNISFVAGYDGAQSSSVCRGPANRVRGILGNDYDRATNNNANLTLTTYLYMGYVSQNIYPTNGNHRFDATVKSGRFQTDKTDADLVNGSIKADAGDCFYASLGGQQCNVGHRYITIEGGELMGIAGGIDQYNSPTDTTFVVRMHGGTLRSALYGAGAFAAAQGHRKYIITGGQIKGWIAGGCNGTDPTSAGGTLPSNTYLYFGGNAKCGIFEGDVPAATQYQINQSQGGNIFGAGSGNSSQPETGQVNNTVVVVADTAQVAQCVYGGGNMGYAQYNGAVHILGGRVYQSVFGGSNQKGGTTTEVYMKGGTVIGGIYGGSNTTGTITGTTNVQVTGGTVGDSAHASSVFGGGLGASTRVGGDVTVGIGMQGGVANQPTLYGDVYGGSQQGMVNTTGTSLDYNKSTQVRIRQGLIKGSVYGGGYGMNGAPANVAGKDSVIMSGATVEGSVFGGNNLSGRPLTTVDVVMTGGVVMQDVYGGGNEASYGTIYNEAVREPHVLITGGKVMQSVFGGGKGSQAVVYHGTIVDVKGTAEIGQHVFGGGNAANVARDTKVFVGENASVGANVFGGGNAAAVGDKNAVGAPNENSTSVVIGGGARIGKNVYGGGNKGTVFGKTHVVVDSNR